MKPHARVIGLSCENFTRRLLEQSKHRAVPWEYEPFRAPLPHHSHRPPVKPSQAVHRAPRRQDLKFLILILTLSLTGTSKPPLYPQSIASFPLPLSQISPQHQPAPDQHNVPTLTPLAHVNLDPHPALTHLSLSLSLPLQPPFPLYSYSPDPLQTCSKNPLLHIRILDRYSPPFPLNPLHESSLQTISTKPPPHPLPTTPHPSHPSRSDHTTPSFFFPLSLPT